jgi:hypothetical protein
MIYYYINIICIIIIINLAPETAKRAFIWCWPEERRAEVTKTLPRNGLSAYRLLKHAL